MFLSLLFAPAMWLTDPQNADALPEPVAVTAANTRYTPSRAVRSATVVPGLPAAPVTVRFQCMVDAHFGEPTACIPLDAGAAPVRSRAEFDRRATAFAAARNNPATPVAVRVAATRVMFVRVQPTSTTPIDPAKPELVPMLFTETVSAADAVTLGDPVAVIPASDLEFDERPDAALLAAYYPGVAQKAGIEVRMTATCRIMPDRTLFCRNARPAAPDARVDAALGRLFELSTYQVLAAVRLLALTKKGDPVVGREVEMRIGFVIGD